MHESLGFWPRFRLALKGYEGFLTPNSNFQTPNSAPGASNLLLPSNSQMEDLFSYDFSGTVIKNPKSVLQAFFVSTLHLQFSTDKKNMKIPV